MTLTRNKNILWACAAAALLCGCPDAAEEPAPPAPAPAPASEPPPIPVSFDNPRASAGAMLALAYEPAASGTLRQVMDAVEAVFRRDIRRGAESGDLRALDLFLEAARQASSDVRVNWMILSADGLRLVDGAIAGVPRTSCALAYPHDLGRIMAKVRAAAKATPSLRIAEGTAAGVRSWEIVDEDQAQDPLFGGVRLSVASLGGRLMILATSPEALAEQVALYRDGRGENAAFAAVSSGRKAAARLFIPSVGALVEASLQDAAGGLGPVEGFVADGVRVFREMGELDLSVSAGPSDGNLQVELRAEAGSEADAEALRASVRAALVPLVVRFGLTADLRDGRSKQILEMLKAAVVAGEGRAVRATMPVSREVVDLVVSSLGAYAGLATGGGADIPK